ncbi:MAG TPA: RNA polymerase sigma factor [Polyangiaceae bacterium]|nr:RNA polymerase sigma factor [Polyangiaceae bacterium]
MFGRSRPPGGVRSPAAPTLPDKVAAIYERYFDFVWRNARRLGVPDAARDDVVQDVFVVVCRRLDDFEGRSSIETWLFGILSHIVTRRRQRDQRRHAKLPLTSTSDDIADLPAVGQPSPHELMAQRQAVELLYELLATLDEDKRAAFILIELEQRPPLEVAQTTGVNVNTIYSRVRAARQHLEAGIARHRAQQGWRHHA